MVGKAGAGLVYICLNMSSELLWICLLYVNQITIKLLLTHTHHGFSWITNHTQAEGHRLAGMSEQGQPTRSWPRGIIWALGSPGATACGQQGLPRPAGVCAPCCLCPAGFQSPNQKKEVPRKVLR